MPNKNNSNRRGKRRGGAKSAASGLSLLEGPQPGAIKKIPRIKGPIKVANELKFVDTAVFPYGVDTTGAVAPLNLLAETDDYNGRTGRQVTIKSVSVTGFAYGTATTGLLHKGRILLVWDNAVNGVTPAITDILTVSSSLSYYNVNNQNRFTILWDHPYVIGPYTAALTDQIVRNIDVEIPLNAVTQFSGTTATIASIQNGAIYLVVVGSNAAGTTAGTAQLLTRCRYHDVD